MTDDKWSLKVIDRTMNFKFYEPEDIEILRMKLIGDWHDYCVSREPKKRLYDEFVKIIDNRFGVNMDDL